MRKNIGFIILIIVFTIVNFSNIVYADTTIHLNIETNTGSIYNQNINVVPCDSDNDPITPDTESAYCAVLQAVSELGTTSDWSWSYPPGAFLNSIGSVVNNNENNGIYWGWFVNLTVGQTGLNEYLPNSDDSILLQYGISPTRITSNSNTPTVGDTITLIVEKSDYNSLYTDTWSPAVGGKIVIGSNTFDLDNNGSYSFLVPDTNAFTIKGQMSGFIDTSIITITPIPTPLIVSGGGGQFTFPSVTENVISNEDKNTTKNKKTAFDVPKAVSFLISNQKSDGSFSEDIYTDWTAIALGEINAYELNKDVLKKYLSENKLTNFARLTDFERRAIALMASGLNPYDINGENYIKKIIDSFDGTQFGETNEDNDDIFALIVLQNAGFTYADKMIANDISFILNRQKENGSWDESVDMTGAGIQALMSTAEKSCFLLGSLSAPTGAALPLDPSACETPQNKELFSAVKKAKEFLKQSQKDTGGWGNVSSTAWAISGILALSEKPEDWIKNDNTPLDYLAINQDIIDGGIKNEYMQNKIWETAYAITALSGKTWNQIMKKFEKPQEKTLVAIKKVTKKSSQEIKDLSIKNTATVINSLEKLKEQPIKRNWFKNLLNKIFGVF